MSLSKSTRSGRATGCSQTAVADFREKETRDKHSLISLDGAENQPQAVAEKATYRGRKSGAKGGALGGRLWDAKNGPRKQKSLFVNR